MPFSPSSSAFDNPVNDDYAAAARPLIHHHHHQAAAVSPASPSSSQGSSSSSFNYRPAIASSSSSSVDTSPPSHKGSHGGNHSGSAGAATTTAYPSLAQFSPRSPRSQHPDDLLKVQRHLYQHANAGEWPRRDSSSQGHAHTMNAAAESSTSALSRPPPPPPTATTHQREDTLSVTPERGTRGSKSRRASSGGSRIPYERQDEMAGRPSAPSSSSSSSTSRAQTSASSSSPSQGAEASTSSPARQHPARPSSPSLLSPPPAAGAPHTRPLPHVDLATYPSQDLLRILAALLQQIATTNDGIRPPNAAEEERDRKRNAKGKAAGGIGSMGGAGDTGGVVADERGAEDASASSRNPQGVTTAAMGALGQPSSTLCFHARNVPSISIESYLLRILKYCPTTNDVFLSLAVYLDRMSRVALGADVNDNPESANRAASQASDDGAAASAAADLVSPHIHPGMKGFAVDSYNIHRLVIAGVTVGSKFFSDVFYTNSRYAKVGGLPVHELNQLELQFLLLNDFKLVIPLSELQSYADRLLVYATDSGAVATRPVKELGPPGEAQGQGQGQRRSSQSSNGAPPTRGSSSTSSSTTTPHAAASSSSSPRPDRSAAAAVQMQEG